MGLYAGSEKSGQAPSLKKTQGYQSARKSTRGLYYVQPSGKYRIVNPFKLLPVTIVAEPRACGIFQLIWSRMECKVERSL